MIQLRKLYYKYHYFKKIYYKDIEKIKIIT